MLQITPNTRTAGNLNITANQRASMSSVLSIDWGHVTGIPNGVQAIGSVTGTGILAVVNSSGVGALRTITGTANEITVTNGDGVAGNPVVSLPAALTFTGKTITGGTFTGVISINGNFWTAGTGTLTLGAGKTATISNTLTFTGTDTSSIAFGTGGTVVYTSNNLSVFAATTSAQLAGIISDETGTGALVFANTPTLIAPILGTPTSGTLTNATGLPVSSGISGLAAGVATFLGTPTSANLAAALTDETGSGAAVFATSPSLTTPTLGVASATTINKVTITAPASAATLTLIDGTILTGPASSGTAMTLGNTETVTGVKTFGSAGAVGRLKVAGTTSGSTVLDATAVASGTLTLPAATDTLVGKATTDTLTNKTYDTAGAGNSLSINGVAATANTGTGAVVRATSPTLVTPALGTPSSGTLTGCTGLPLAGLAAQAAYTLVVNNTGGSASPTAITIDGMTVKASPAAGDEIMIWDVAGAALKKATVSSVSAAGSVSSIAGNTGAFTLTAPITNATNAIVLNASITPQGRLTLQTVTGAMTTTQSAKTTIFYTPYVGNLVSIYDGTNMIPTAFTELSVLTTDATKSPAAIGASKVNDWFVWSDAGTLRLGHGPDWTNDTTRGYSLSLISGIYTNTSSITNGPAASRGTWVGTTRSNGSSQLDWIFGASGTAAFFGVWNLYNRVNVGTALQEGTASSAYTSSTIRGTHNTAIARASFVRGLDEDSVSVLAQAYTDTNTGAAANFGFGLDSSTVNTAQMQATAPSVAGIGSVQWSGLPGLGFHFLQHTEASSSNGVSYTAYFGATLSSFVFTGRM